MVKLIALVVAVACGLYVAGGVVKPIVKAVGKADTALTVKKN